MDGERTLERLISCLTLVFVFSVTWLSDTRCTFPALRKEWYLFLILPAMALSRHPYLTITALQRSLDPYLCQPLCVKTLLPVWFVQPILAFTLTHILLSYVNSNLTRLQPLLYGLFAPSHRMLYFKDDASEMITEKYVLKKRRWLAGALEVTVADLQWHIQTEFNHEKWRRQKDKLMILLYCTWTAL